MKHVMLRSGSNDGLFHAWKKDFSSRLKQHALLFDQIGIYRLNYLYEYIGSYGNLKSYPSDLIQTRFKPLLLDLEWLEKKEIIFDLSISETISTDDVVNILDTNSKAAKELRSLNKTLRKLMDDEKPVKNLIDSANKIDSIQKQESILLRLASLVLETTRRASAITALPYSEYSLNLPSSTKSDVISLVITKLPLPDDSTPWEKLDDFRHDPDNQVNLQSLRRWITKTANLSLPPNELEEEIEWLTNEFQRHMNLHKMKANTEALEVIVKTPLEIIENLVTLKFSKIPEPFFTLKKRQINLLEAELKAPGREMAYIIKTQETFSSNE